MFSLVVAIILAGIGTVFGDIVLSDEFYRTVNTFLNLLSAVLVPLVVFKINQWTRTWDREGKSQIQETRQQVEETKQQVNKVAERTEHLADWDGKERRDH